MTPLPTTHADPIVASHSVTPRHRCASARCRGWIAVALAVLPAMPALLSAAPDEDAPRKVFAHYMGCYPVAAAATAWHRQHDPGVMRHDGERQFDRGGDRWRNWPLVPDGMRLSLEDAADLEIRRALRAGLDGFAIDAWAGGEDAKRMFTALITVARDRDYPFEITICLDPGIQSNQGLTDSIRWMLDQHGDNPKLARRDGKPLIFGYMSNFIGFRHGAGVLANRPEHADADARELRRDRDLRLTPEGWAIMADGHRQMERDIGQPLYFHYCMSAFFHQVPNQLHNEDTLIAAAAFMAGQFDAVGAFLGHGPRYDRMAGAVREAGAEWSQPLYYQYENLYWGGNRISQGSDILRTTWEAARRNESTLIQFVTWNDYTENTHLAPGYETRYAVLDLNRYYVDWWKTGVEPTPEHDKIYLFFRKYPVDATIFPFQPIQPERDGVIEVLTILTEPARMRLPGRDAEWDAPAGLSWRHMPVTPGPLAVELLRDGEVVQRLDSPEPITQRPFRQMNSMAAVSTEFERHWREDFGEEEPPLLRGLYADDDGDGLPNWFEMYWFGTFLDWSTATGADPAAIGADGKTLLEHYLDQTDPTLAPTVTDQPTEQQD